MEKVIGLKLESALKASEFIEITLNESEERVIAIATYGNDLICFGNGQCIKIDSEELRYIKRLGDNRTLVLTRDAKIVC